MSNDYWYEYEIALGLDTEPDADADNFEAYFDNPLRGQRVPKGAVTTRVMSAVERIDGWQDVELTTEGCYFSELDAYVTAIHGSWDGEDAEVTLRHRQRDNTFAYFNAVAHLPIDGQDYQHNTTQEILDVHLRFTILGPADV